MSNRTYKRWAKSLGTQGLMGFVGEEEIEHTQKLADHMAAMRELAARHQQAGKAGVREGQWMRAYGGEMWRVDEVAMSEGAPWCWRLMLTRAGKVFAPELVWLPAYWQTESVGVDACGDARFEMAGKGLYGPINKPSAKDVAAWYLEKQGLTLKATRPPAVSLKAVVQADLNEKQAVYVVVDAAKKALFGGKNLKVGIHFVVYSDTGLGWLVVAGKKLDAKDLADWVAIFGERFIGVHAKLTVKHGLQYHDALTGAVLTVPSKGTIPAAIAAADEARHARKRGQKKPAKADPAPPKAAIVVAAWDFVATFPALPVEKLVTVGWDGVSAIDTFLQSYHAQLIEMLVGLGVELVKIDAALSDIAKWPPPHPPEKRANLLQERSQISHEGRAMLENYTVLFGVEAGAAFQKHVVALARSSA